MDLGKAHRGTLNLLSQRCANFEGSESSVSRPKTRIVNQGLPGRKYAGLVCRLLDDLPAH